MNINTKQNKGLLFLDSLFLNGEFYTFEQLASLFEDNLGYSPKRTRMILNQSVRNGFIFQSDENIYMR